MRRIVLAFALLATTAQAPPPPDPIVVALGQMLAEAQQREAMALVRAVKAEQVAKDTKPAPEAPKP